MTRKKRVIRRASTSAGGNSPAARAAPCLPAASPMALPAPEAMASPPPRVPSQQRQQGAVPPPADSFLSPRPTAIVTVFDKTGVADLCCSLAALGWRFLSCGGTLKALEAAGLDCVEDVADLIEATPPHAVRMFGGKLKTLQPSVHGALLAATESDLQELRAHRIPPIDMVICNLAPHGGDVAGIDIGGASLLRCAAKACRRVIPVARPGDYQLVLTALKGATHHSEVSQELRRNLAAAAMRYVAQYDASVFEAGWIEGVGGGGGGGGVPSRARILDRFVALYAGEPTAPAPSCVPRVRRGGAGVKRGASADAVVPRFEKLRRVVAAARV